MPVLHRKKSGRRFLTSERQTISFDLTDNFIIVGERINPTGKKKLQAQLREGSMEMVSAFAEEQEACGAGILDVNMGMSGIDEKAMMLKAIETIGGITNLPLSLDSSHVDVLEAALRRYPGRALINSISYEKTKVDALLPLAKKYGAMFILLPLSDEGLPKDITEKIHIIEKIKEKAFALGLTREDIIVDGLVATVGANKTAATDTLETIRYCKEQGLATIQYLLWSAGAEFYKRQFSDHGHSGGTDHGHCQSLPGTASQLRLCLRPAFAQRRGRYPLYKADGCAERKAGGIRRDGRTADRNTPQATGK